jgi:NAD-dependent deacetylase
VTRCSRCDHIRPDLREDGKEVPKCPKCGAPMRPGVVWFGEQLDGRKTETVENYLAAGACDVVLVIGTTALFGYIIDWAMRGAKRNGRLIEVNPEETPLSKFATESYRESAAVALPRLVEELVAPSEEL